MPANIVPTMRGMTPRPGASIATDAMPAPSIVCVLPDDVCPNARMVPLYPVSTSATTGSTTA